MTTLRGIPIKIGNNGLHLGDFKTIPQLVKLCEDQELTQIVMDEYAHDYYSLVLLAAAKDITYEALEKLENNPDITIKEINNGTSS